MNNLVARWIAVGSIALTTFVPVAGAQEGSKALPTLLIKGEIVSVEQTDPAAPLLKVKDRYGFETPIYLGEETKIARADQALAAADLTQGLAVEVEYNFDINTAKRHAVNVKVTAGEAPAAPAAQSVEAPAQTVEEAASELTAETVAPEAAPEAEAESAPVASDETVPAAESSGETPPQ
jgi:hypothetical protein